MSASLRPFPHPYRAAFSICNDCDLMTGRRYLYLKDLFSSFPSAISGKKPGLPYRESFFVFNENPYERNQLCLADQPDLLLPDLESGYLGILHSWGDFNFNPAFSREHAEKATELMGSAAGKLRVWVNHGTGHNLQNIGTGYGDLPEYVDGSGRSYRVREYHRDLLDKLGIRYYWLGKLTTVAGQNVRLTARMRREALKLGDNCEYSSANGALRRMVRKRILGPVRARLAGNSLIEESELRDGSRVFSFPRYGSHALATADDISRLVAPEVIEKLISRGGAMVFYTHLAKTSAGEESMAPDCLAALGHIKKRYDEGELWVCPVDRLLEYERLKRSVRWEKRDGNLVINGFSNRVEGEFEPAAEELKGLCFNVGTGEKPAVFYRDGSLKTRLNPAGASGGANVEITGSPQDS